MLKVTDIMWDIDEEEYGNVIDELCLPSEADIPNGISEEDIADWLSDTFGFCVYEFDIVDKN